MFAFMKEPMPALQDRAVGHCAAGVLTLALSHAAGAGLFYASSDVHDYLRGLHFALPIIAVVVMLPPFIPIFFRYWKSRKARAEKGGASCEEPTGFVAEVYTKACVHACTATLLFLVVIEPLTDRWLSDVSPNFVVQVTLAVLFGVLGVSFFINSRNDGSDLEELDDFDTEPGA